ncbi:hypothetical protein [Hyphobacterium sp.]|uniref:hypothetical protein n=1 Tax=Hyphobacterium sp. TaxID=2004662 RepID=UPI003B519E5B
MDTPETKPLQAASLASGGSAIGGLFAFVGASCCVIPILLIHMGVASGLVARLGWFARWQPVFLAVSVALLATALFLGLRTNSRSRLFWITWTAGAVFTALALILPFFEADLQRALLDWFRR